MYRYAQSAALLLLVGAGPAAAQVTIEGPDRVEVGRLATFTASGPGVGKGAYLWDVSPCDRAELVELGPTLVMTAPPGSYRVRLRLVRQADGGVAVDNAVRVLTVAGRERVELAAAVSVPSVPSVPLSVPSAPVVVPSVPLSGPALPLPAAPVVPLSAFPAPPALLLEGRTRSSGMSTGGGLLERRLERRIEAREEAEGRSRLRGIGIGYEPGVGLRAFIGRP